MVVQRRAHGRQGWVPVDLLAPAPTAGEMAHVLADYEATELPLHRGEALVVEQQRGVSRAAPPGSAAGYPPHLWSR